MASDRIEPNMLKLGSGKGKPQRTQWQRKEGKAKN